MSFISLYCIILCIDLYSTIIILYCQITLNHITVLYHVLWYYRVIHLTVCSTPPPTSCHATDPSSYQSMSRRFNIWTLKCGGCYVWSVWNGFHMYLFICSGIWIILITQFMKVDGASPLPPTIKKLSQNILDMSAASHSCQSKHVTLFLKHYVTNESRRNSLWCNHGHVQVTSLLPRVVQSQLGSILGSQVICPCLWLDPSLCPHCVEDRPEDIWLKVCPAPCWIWERLQLSATFWKCAVRHVLNI